MLPKIALKNRRNQKNVQTVMEITQPTLKNARPSKIYEVTKYKFGNINKKNYPIPTSALPSAT